MWANVTTWVLKSKYLLKFWYKMFGSMCSANTGKLEVGHHQEVEFCVVVTAQVKGPESQLSRLSSLVWAGARVSVWAQAEGKISWRSTPKERSPVLSICSVICPSGSQQRYVALCSPTTILSSLSLTQLLSITSHYGRFRKFLSKNSSMKFSHCI